MNQLNFVCICLLIVFLCCSVMRRTEAFSCPTDTVVLLGDSILKNNVYVVKGVDELLREKIDGDIINLARDGATIRQTYKQIDEIPDRLNRHETAIFLSVGGNDIVELFVNGSYDVEKDGRRVNTLFLSYKQLVNELREKMNKARLILLDIYYPVSEDYRAYHPLIKRWNRLQSELTDDVVNVSRKLTNEDDFVYDIEPSDNGGEKIAELIKNW
jgi:hypothetical protein